GVGLPPDVGSGVGGGIEGSSDGAADGACVGAAVGGGAKQVSFGSVVFVGLVDSAGVVSLPACSVPPAGKALAANASVQFRRGISTEPRGSAIAPWTSGYWITAR